MLETHAHVGHPGRDLDSTGDHPAGLPFGARGPWALPVASIISDFISQLACTPAAVFVEAVAVEFITQTTHRVCVSPWRTCGWSI
jgi:hypothetical protein